LRKTNVRRRTFMKVETFRHENVLPNGTFAYQAGAVEVKGKIVMSQNNGGCGIDTCHCSDGHWITIVKPRTEEGVVEGMKVNFDDMSEMQKFFDERELFCV